MLIWLKLLLLNLSQGKGKKKKKDFTKQDGEQITLGVANKGKKKDYTKGKYFHCGEKGHWKRNCPIFRASKNKGMKISFILEICLVQNPTNIPGVCIQVLLTIFAILCRVSKRPESRMKGNYFLLWLMGAGFQL